MVFNLHKVHLGHPAVTAQKRAQTEQKRAEDCSNGGFYISPKSGDVVANTKPTTFSWNTNCLSPAPKYVDIYLYAPAQNQSLIQAFNSADYAHGSYETTLNPSWWGLTPNVNLQLTIVSHGTPAFLSTTGAGPIFSATYNASDASATPTTSSNESSGIIQQVKNVFSGGGLSGGALAAAVIVPLLVIGIIIGAYVKIRRGREQEKRKRWSQAVDKRMSTISTDWRSMSGSSANAAIRNSVAVRTSAFGSVAGRPSSTFSVAGAGQAGIGTGRFGGLETSEIPVPQMSQLRQPRNSTYSNTDRISRVSFAADVRVDSQQPPLPSPPASRLTATRSYHQGHSFDEPRDVDAALQLSPTQTQGPFALSTADIHARASGDSDDFRKEVLKMPAMTLMRTGHDGGDVNQYVLPPAASSTSSLTTPSPILKKGSSSPSPSSASPMGMPVPSVAMSPDDMLKAYASGRANTGTPGTASRTASVSSMRVLYNPATPTAPVPDMRMEDHNPFRKSLARTTVYTDSMYSGMADEDAEVDGRHPR